jgi:hypothetical protein
VRKLLLPIALCLLVLATTAQPALAAERPAVLVLVDGLSWEEVENDPELAAALDAGAAATLSAAQGGTPADPRLAYVFIGAGARLDSSIAPRELPEEPARIPDAFTGTSATVRPGALGDALSEAGIRAAAVGERAYLVAMDSRGEVPLAYTGKSPAAGLRAALEEGAGFVAVEAGQVRETGELVAAAREAGAVTALASPMAPADAAELTPFVLLVPGSEPGILYSPSTRTPGLVTGSDVAPSMLDALDVPVPPEMVGRAVITEPGDPASVRDLHERLAFVANERFRVWGALGLTGAGLILLAAVRWRGRGLAAAILALTALPAGALLAAAVPTTSVAAVSALTAAFAAGLAVPVLRLSRSWSARLAAVFLATATLIALDVATGSHLMRGSTLGFNPATGARFHGIGNEYAAVLLGALCAGAGALRSLRPLPGWILPMAGAAAVLVLGMPGLGANVGGSLAAGAGIGATIGLLTGGNVRKVAAWSAVGFAFAAASFLLSGRLAPEASHGARAATGETDLPSIAVQKLLLSLQHLLNPALLLLLAAAALIIYAGWRRARGTALGAGILSAGLAGLAMGALNDSGLVATLLTLAYPAAAAATVLLTGKPRRYPGLR